MLNPYNPTITLIKEDQEQQQHKLVDRVQVKVATVVQMFLVISI